MKYKTKLKSNNFFQVFWQCLLGALFMGIVLFAFGHVVIHNSGIWAVGVGSMASSAYLIFVMPHQPPARFSQLFFSYLVCIVIGLAGHVALLHLHTFFWTDAITAIAVGLSLLILSSFKLKHSCAAGICVMFVLELQDYYPVLIVLSAVLLLGIIHECLKSKMRDLV